MTLTRGRLLAALAGVGAAPSIAFAPARSADDVLRVGSSLEDDVSPLVYAAANGTFRKLGLDVQPQATQSGSAAAAAVAGGSLQFAKSSLMSLVSAHARGVPFVLVAPGSINTDADPIAQLIVAKNAPYKTAKDLDGKTLASSSLKDVKTISTMAWIDQHGGDSKSLRFVEVPNASIVAALEENRIAAATVLNPVLSDALASGKVRSLGPSYDAIAPRWLVTAWFTTREYAYRNAGVVRRFAEGLRQASLAINARPADAAPALSQFLHDDPARLASMKRSPLGIDLDPREIQPVIDVAARYGVIAKPFPAHELIG
jgi:NitT/TauT family transport system substrate-binding protein